MSDDNRISEETIAAIAAAAQDIAGDSESGNADVLKRLQETDAELKKRFLEA